MRRYSKEFILIDDKKFHLVSVKEEGRWSKIGFIRKSEEKDEYGFIPIGENMLKCPHKDSLPPLNMIWTPLPGEWINVKMICKGCWGSHSTPDGRFNCILRSLQIKQFKDGVAMGISKMTHENK